MRFLRRRLLLQLVADGAAVATVLALPSDTLRGAPVCVAESEKARARCLPRLCAAALVCRAHLWVARDWRALWRVARSAAASNLPYVHQAESLSGARRGGDPRGGDETVWVVVVAVKYRVRLGPAAPEKHDDGEMKTPRGS